jgi:menaquinone-dependent protoporphyrinogen IX oxidase
MSALSLGGCKMFELMEKMNGIVVYGSRYGAAAQYAQWAGEALDMPVVEYTEAGADLLTGIDTVVMVTSVYMGGFLIKDWMHHHADALGSKHLFLLLVGATEEERTEHISAMFDQNIPQGLAERCHRHYTRGKNIISELGFKDRLLLRIGAFFAKDAKEKAAMLSEFDEVDKEGLDLLIKDVRRG